jgi:glycerophosphoryl diester phosphodiesterase
MAIQVLAHRGASSYAPENTIPAFDLALEMGADGIETDIRATADGELVLLHDARVDRTSDGQGAIDQLEWERVRELDAGSWFGEGDKPARMMALAEFLERYLGRTSLALEIKGDGIAPAVVELLQGMGVGDEATITSFDWDSCLAVHGLSPQRWVGWLTREFDAAAIRRVAEAGLAQICPLATQTSAELVSAAHAAGLSVRAWGVGDEVVMRQAVAAGVDGMTVNFPDKLIEYLVSMGLR